ncbi:MAG: DMT family transporter [Pseudomonadota bacterium]
MSAPNVTTGLLAAIGVIFVWSGFIVFSRAGVTSGLTAYDVAALRFIVAGALTAPFMLAWWPRDLPLKIQILLALCGPGALYSALMFAGLAEASAAYGGVFANGSLPIFTILIVLATTGALPGRMQLVATAVIVAGGIMVGWRGMSAGGADVAIGVALFLVASAVISAYIIAIKAWSVTPRQALAIVNIPNALIFLPIWWFALPSTMADADTLTVAWQAAFQGLGPGFLALILFAMCAYHLGPAVTAAFSAVVPATAALLAIPVLGEMPTPLEWAGIAVVSAGLGLMVRAR